jgi:hypothetical protein
MFLVEKMPAETPQDVAAFLEILVREVYGRRPEWLEYDLRESYRFQGREFIRMFCAAGSVHAHLTLRASTGSGISRDILQLGTREDRPLAWLIHQGHETEHDPDEVKEIGQPTASPNGGPAERSDSARASGGPPSVS